MGQTIWQSMEKKGYSRRQFLQFCASAAAAAGIAQSGVAQVVSAFEKKERPVVVWLHFQECTGCSESFIRSSHPMVADALLDVVSLNYHETLMAPSGFQAEKSLADTIRDHKGKYILAVEGAVPTKDGGVYCMVQRQDGAFDSAGSCRGCGGHCGVGHLRFVRRSAGREAESDQRHSDFEAGEQAGDQCAGLPANCRRNDGGGDAPAGAGQDAGARQSRRPKEFYGRRVHDTCYRRPNYDAGLFVESWDDENARKGYCLYKMGCKGPVTYNSCSVVRWNEGTSSPIQSGHGCIGCSEPGFWDNGPLYQHLASFPGFGIESTADTVGTVVAAATLAGVAAHAVVTNIRKKEVIAEVHADDQKES